MTTCYLKVRMKKSHSHLFNHFSKQLAYLSHLPLQTAATKLLLRSLPICVKLSDIGT